MIDKVSKLEAYQAAKRLVVDVYAQLKLFPKEEQYALCDQMRRAVISIPSNITEGMGRFGDKDQAHFIDIAYGSLLEVQCQMDIAMDLGYITKEQSETIESNMRLLGSMLIGLRNKRRPSTSQPFVNG